MPTIRGSFVAPSYQVPTHQEEIGRWKREEKTLRRFQNVLVEDPYLDSQAALVLLIKKYITIQESPYQEGHIPSAYQRARASYIKMRLERDGQLLCFQCNHALHNEPYHPKTKRWRVTVDHIVKLSHGGALTDFSNMRLACGNCNSTRDNGWDDKTIKENQEKRFGIGIDK